MLTFLAVFRLPMLVDCGDQRRAALQRLEISGPVTERSRRRMVVEEEEEVVEGGGVRGGGQVIQRTACSSPCLSLENQKLNKN